MPERELHPINCVDLVNAKAFCAYKGARLPTFDEWEWIAEGRTAALQYPWGNALPAERACWSGIVKRKETCRVASFSAGDSAQHISDLSGNVSEWTTTPFEAMPDTFVLAGGCWWDKDPDALKVLSIGHDVAAGRSDMIGFRCVKEP
jgi:formylglycine-generating enzyme required for sulfatase activity